jgi:hypothetical protein
MAFQMTLPHIEDLHSFLNFGMNYLNITYKNKFIPYFLFVN